MKKKLMRTFRKDSQAISAPFLALYIAVIVILLMSAVFAALEASGASLAQSMVIEQERLQENIVLEDRSLNTTPAGYFDVLRVNNTGTIAVRIRGIYINNSFICDPSEFEGDAYVNPKEAIHIHLMPNVVIYRDDPIENPLDAYWTVVTERGTKAKELGEILLEGNYTIVRPPNYQIGPLMLLFDWFHWRTPTTPWAEGWSVPAGTKDVVWRIRLVNVDMYGRAIELSKFTCLSLTQNEEGSPRSWYIDTAMTQNMTLLYGKGYFLYFKWDVPFGEPGCKMQAVFSGADTTCITFLTFYGKFVENGTRMPFGQSVPFEAVILTGEKKAGSIDLSANPAKIWNDGTSTSIVTARVSDTIGNVMSEVRVDFYTSAGSLSASYAMTNSTGYAEVILTSSESFRTARVVAECQSISASANVLFTPYAIKVTPIPSTIRRTQSSNITLQIIDKNGQNVSIQGIGINVTISQWTGQQNRKPTLTPTQVTTNQYGTAWVILQGQNGAGVATVSALATDAITGSKDVTLTT